jgi:hypothetical protein
MSQLSTTTMTSPRCEMASPPRSPAIPDAVQQIYNTRYISVPLLSALSRLQDQLKETGNTEASIKRESHNESDEPSWGRQSPQLTPTPSPSPSPSPTHSPSHLCDAIEASHRQLQLPPTPPDTSPQRETQASASPLITTAARRYRDKPALRSPPQPSHTMLRRSRARASRAQESRFWELDVSGRRARRIVGG